MNTGLFKIMVLQSEGIFLITADKVTGGENYVIELQMDQVEPILMEFNGDYSKMVENLEVLSKRLVLLNPQAAKRGKRVRRVKRRKHTKTKSA
jgi:hypothetical protein